MSKLSLSEAVSEFRKSRLLGLLVGLDGQSVSALPDARRRVELALPRAHERAFTADDVIYALYKVVDEKFVPRPEGESTRSLRVERRLRRFEEVRLKRLAQAASKTDRAKAPPVALPPSAHLTREASSLTANEYIQANYKTMRTWELAKHTGYSPHTIRRKLSDWNLRRS